jgi:hypothetical protein
VGVFFISYILVDRTDRFGEYMIFSGDHPISVGVPPSVETVTNTNDSGEGSLRESLENVGSGSTILFDLHYPATVVLDSELVIDRSLTIVGPEEGELTLSGNNTNGVITIVNPRSVNISNLNIKSGNFAEWGGGISCGSSSLYLSNMNIIGNMAEGTGAIYFDGSDLRLENVTVSNNISVYTQCGGIFIGSGGNLTLINTLLWGNSPSEILGNPNSVTISHSDIQYGVEGMEFEENVVNWLGGNMSVYPMFVDPSSHDYRLLEESPCIDAGIQDTTLVYNEGRDTLFIPTIDYSGSAPDIGANEYTSPALITEYQNQSEEYSLDQNYPNPFNPTTAIGYRLSAVNDVELSVFNSLGQKMVTLVSERQGAGHHQVEWDASDFTSGVYYYRIRAGKYVNVKKMILLK